VKAILGLVLIFAIAIVVLSMLKSAGRGGSSSRAFRFARRDPFLRQDEIHLYKRLTNALADAYIFPQVAMSAFVQHKGRTQAARNLFAQKYVDYIVCDRETMRPLYVIELDGTSHGSAKAQKRDKQKNDVLASAGIPIMRYTSKDVDLRIILRDYESVTSPRPATGMGAPGSARESKPIIVQTPVA
jgi:very-short-patch-repair endonuclease